MKKIFLIPILGIFVFALAITNSSKDENNNLFLGTDNIAFAQAELSGGYSCSPKNNHFCYAHGIYITNYSMTAHKPKEVEIN
jgi:hypothetical protein